MQKITPFLWFDDKAEEAANFYTSIFKNSKIESISRLPEGSPATKGTVMMVTFQLDGQEFMALNGGPVFKFTEATSLFVNCETQAEVDDYWEKLSAGGEKGRCGWLKDKYGLSWQIVPTALGELMQGDDPERSKRVMQAMLKMDKIDMDGLKKAYQQGASMHTDLIATVSITINASRIQVWKALVDPEAIRQYMFGTNVVSDWKEGSPILWKGEWQGRSYEDKGVILLFKPERTIQYSHFSPLSGLPDQPESYHKVTIHLTGKGKQILVSLSQDNNPTEEDRQHSENNWGIMLTALKEFLEQDHT
jgi:predicted 3-demethylubiquinone-9 3-methyltransferase (glyoxalase superfamily)/uncharacterized protein YndB with AHSA1/START domain